MMQLTVQQCEDCGRSTEVSLDEAMSTEGGWECACGSIWNVVHNCMAHATLYQSDGALGHGWECGLCGSFLQAG